MAKNPSQRLGGISAALSKPGASFISVFMRELGFAICMQDQYTGKDVLLEVIKAGMEKTIMIPHNTTYIGDSDSASHVMRLLKKITYFIEVGMAEKVMDLNITTHQRKVVCKLAITLLTALSDTFTHRETFHKETDRYLFFCDLQPYLEDMLHSGRLISSLSRMV